MGRGDVSAVSWFVMESESAYVGLKKRMNKVDTNIHVLPDAG